MLAIKVLKRDAEKVRQLLIKKGILDKNYKIKKVGDFIYIPVKKKILGFELVNVRFEKIEREKIKLPAFDVIGDIAIIEIRDEIKGKEIAERILKQNKNVKTVVKKASGHEGMLRIQKHEYVAGIKKFETLHKESSCKFLLDINKVYFSPRLANERLRIAKLIKDKEEVLVMFSGIGIYPIIIEKHSNAREIYGIELNKDAHEYALRNLSLNKCKKIKLLQGDVRDVLPKINKKFDRIIMPLPRGAETFLDVALSKAKNKAFIHIYQFCKEEDLDKIKENIVSICNQYNFNCKILNVVKTGQQKPYVYRFCLDLFVEKNE